MSTKSLLARNNDLSSSKKQLEVLSNGIFQNGELPTFAKKIREIMGYKPRQKMKKNQWVEVWIGISMDEVVRMKPSRFWWQENRWPLLEKKMTRQHCLDWYEGKGFNVPVKSACIGCPFHDDNFWIDMRDNRPNEFKEAVFFDKNCC